MPRYLIVRKFSVTETEMPRSGKKTKQVGQAIAGIVWEHSHVQPIVLPCSSRSRTDLMRSRCLARWMVLTLMPASVRSFLASATRAGPSLRRSRSSSSASARTSASRRLSWPRSRMSVSM
jgi:hypothetical protein